MKWFASVLAVFVVYGGSTGKVFGAEEPFTRVRPYNLSSHLPEFFRDLLSARVWVFERRGSIGAVYFDPKGAVFGCWLRNDGSGFERSRRGMRWKIGTSTSRSNLEISWPTAEGLRYYRMVIVYDGVTGRFHGERFSAQERKWRVVRDGWVQATWPRVLAEGCQGLVLPWELAANEGQTLAEPADARDRSRAVLKHPGWKRSFPGAVGLGAVRGKPTLTLGEMEAARQRAHGKISIGMSGGKRVVVAWPTYTEVWSVDEQDEIIDLAITRRVGDGSVALVRWEKSGRINSYHIGYPYPLIATDRLHSAFKMMDDLAAAQKTVFLKASGIDAGDYVFSADGGVRGPAGAGAWWLSRGAVFLKVGEKVIDVPWRQFARLSGWGTGGK